MPSLWRQRSSLSLLGLLSFPLMVVAVGEEASPRRLTIDDEYQLRDIGKPTLSPTGDRVAYTVTTHHFDENDSTHRIWMMPVGGGAPFPMTSKQTSSWAPQFSADGRRLYFLSARDDDETQVWFLDLVHGGEAQQLTKLPRGCSSINFSPDEESLVLVYKDQEQDEKSGQPWVVDRLQFKRDYAGYLDRRRQHLYVYRIEADELTQLTSGDYDDASPAWSPDAKTIAFVSNRTEEPDGNYNSDIWLVDVANRDQGENLVRVTSNRGPDTAPQWHPDGKSIAYVSAPDLEAGHYATQHLAMVTLGADQHQWLTKELDRNVSGLQFSKDGRYLYFKLEDRGEDHLARMPSHGGKITRPIRGRVSVSSFAPGADGTVVAVMSTADQPSELFVVEGMRQLTQLNTERFSSIALGETEEIHFPSHDGLEIEGFVTKPPFYNPAFRYPTIVRIHGGPVSQYSHGFSFQSHLLAAHDYVVVRCNPRGSSGYGRDFAMGLYQGWGEKDHRDVLAAVDHVIKLGYADPDRLGVGGFSYGGILTNYLITQTDRFQAAVSGAGSALYVASYGHDEYQRWYEWEIGLPWENRELWERLSPFNYVQNVKTPTLFMCGEKDWNVPVQNSEQMYQALRRLGVPTQLVVYPDEHHGGWSFQHNKDYTERLLAWYDQHLKRAGTTTRQGPAAE